MCPLVSILATNYEAYANVPFGGDGGAYSEIMDATRDATVGIYHITGKAGIYAGAIAFLIAIILLIWNSTNSKKSAESKQHVIYVLSIILLIGGTTGIVVSIAKIFMNL